MNILDLVLLVFFIVTMIIYCAVFHEKSLLFLTSIVWFIFNIVIISCNIYFDINLNIIPSQEVSNYFLTFSVFITNLKDIHLLLFFAMIILFFIRKKKKTKKGGQLEITKKV